MIILYGKKEWTTINQFAFLFVLLPGLIIATKTQYVRKTDATLLKCHLLQEKFTWLRLDTNLIYATDTGVNPDLTLALKNRLGLRDRSLEIRNVSESDKGSYRCNAKDGEENIDLQVVEPPTRIRVLQDNGTNNVSGIEGQNITLTCTVTSGRSDNETITWIRNGSVLNVGGPEMLSLTFVPTILDDLNTYTCKADNGIDQPLMYSVQLKITYAPHVVINKAESTTVTTILICEAKGILSKYTFEPWEHLTESRQHIRYLNGFQNRSTSTLQLRKSVESGGYQDSGIYVCRVSKAVRDVNGQLLQNYSITLPYTGNPVFVSPTGKIKHGQVGGNVSLEAYVFSDQNQTSLNSYWGVSNKLVNCTRCKQSCDKLKLQTTFHDALVEVNGYRCFLAIQNIQESDFQMYTITVSNTYGNSSITVQLTSVNKEEPFKAVYIAIIFISVTVVVVMLLTCWQGINVIKRREDAFNYTVNEEGFRGVAENSLYQLGTLPRSSDEYSSIDRRSPIDGRFDSEVLVHTVAQNSGNQLGVVAAAHSYELSSSSDEYSSIDRRSQIDGRFASDEFYSGEQFIQPGAVPNSSENIIVLQEYHESTRLHYAEVSFEDVDTIPRHNEPHMRELLSSTEYAQVEHTVKPNPLPESGSDVSSEEDFVYVRNIQQWRQELFK